MEKKVSVQVVATGDSTRNRLREWRNESQILKDKAARKKNDEMQEAWRKKNDDFMKKCEKNKNKKEAGRLKCVYMTKRLKEYFLIHYSERETKERRKDWSLKRKSGRK